MRLIQKKKLNRKSQPMSARKREQGMKRNHKLKEKVHSRAEEEVQKQGDTTQPLKPANFLRLIRELQTKQLELEMQNDKLVQARAEAEAAYRQYSDLYDFAPVGYFTLTRDGTVQRVNLPGADLMGVDQEGLIGCPLATFVSGVSIAAFNDFFEKLLSGTGRQTCELSFLKNEGDPLWVRMEATCFEGGPECRAVMVNISERKKMEHVLQESENRFRTTIQEVQTVAVQGYGVDGTTQYWNMASEKLYGYSAEEAIGRNLLDLIIPPEIREEVRRDIQLMAESGQPVPAAELSLMRKDGSHVTVYSSHAIVSIPGLPRELFCLDVDLTERKRISSLLHARVRISEIADTHSLDELLQKALDEAEKLTGSSIGFAHFIKPDQETLHLQMWSTNTLEHMCTAEGKDRHYSVEEAGVWAECVYTRAPVIHNDYASLPHRKGLPEGHAPIQRELIVPVLRNEMIVMIMGVGNKPTDYDEQDLESLSQLAGLAWDIVQRKQAEDALKLSERRYRLLHESMIDGYVSVDMNGKFVECNESYRNMLGYSDAELAQLTYKDITPEKWHAAEQAIVEEQIIKRGYSDIYEKEYIRKDGSVFPVELHTVLIRDDTGIPEGMWAIVRDITERKYDERALEAANLELQTALLREQQLSRTDPLTGVNNRRHLYELAEHEIQVAERYQRPLSVIMFDIDHFKQVNDNYGHKVGDQILKIVTDVSCAELRSADVIGRYGGEEFIVLLPMTNAQQALPLAERIRTNISSLNIPTFQGKVNITLSIGVVELQPAPPAETVEEVFRRADEAMYAAKQAGRNRTELR